MSALPQCPLGFEWIEFGGQDEFPIYDAVAGVPTGESIGYLFLGVNQFGEPWRYAVKNPQIKSDWDDLGVEVARLTALGLLIPGSYRSWVESQVAKRRLRVTPDNPRTFDPDGGVL